MIHVAKDSLNTDIVVITKYAFAHIVGFCFLKKDIDYFDTVTAGIEVPVGGSGDRMSKSQVS